MERKAVPFWGCYRRLIDLRNWDGETVVAWLEDDFHHFGVTIVHDGSVVKDVRTAAPRAPWTTCATASAPLRQLIGQPLIARCSDVGRLIDMRRQCTHLFDIAGLALAHAFHGRAHRRYHATVEKAGSSGEDLRRAILRENQAEVMAWDLSGSDKIIGPERYANHTTERGFREWIETMEQEEAEYAFVLRRAVFVANGRVFNFTGVRRAVEMGIPPVCHTYQPENREEATRNNNFTGHDSGPEGMLSLVDGKP